MTTSPTLGTAVDGGAPVTIDIAEWIGTDLGVIAKKGFGKSGLLRVLFEQTYGLIQQIIIDPEGEFHTLREVGGYLIAGGDEADCPATPANAAALAKTLMENPGISAIIQLDHLKGSDPQLFVSLFIEALMEVPKEHWHPVMLCVDETQRFAPQDSRVISSAAMEDLVQRGRKRGITPVFATLRNADVDKTLTGGVSTWFFGRVGTDIDRRHVANSLAFTSSSAEAKDLPFLPRRRFWAFGNSIGDRPVLFDVAKAQTTIVKAGSGLSAMPPPPKSMAKLLAAMAKAAEPPKPAAVKKELDDKGAAIVPRDMPGPAHTPAQPSADIKAAIRKEGYSEGYTQGHFDGFQEGTSKAFGEGHDACAERVMTTLEELIDDIRPSPKGDIDVGVDDRDIPDLILPGPKSVREAAEAAPLPVRQPRASRQEPVSAQGNISMEQAEEAVAAHRAKDDGPFVMTDSLQRVLDVLRWWSERGHPAVSRQRACIMAGYSPKASTFGVYIGKLMRADLVEIPSPGQLQITAAGYALANKTSAGLSLTDAARELLDPRPREIFDILVEVGPSGISRHVLADRMGLSRGASTLGVYIGKVMALGFAEIPRPGEVALADWLRI